NTYADGFKVLNTIFRLYKNYKPGRFFTWLAAMLMIIAVIFFIPVLVTFIKEGVVPRLPTLVVCGFVAIAAIQAYFSGMILSTLVEKDKRDFEYRLIDAENKFKAVERR
ncbi:MAG: glycosyl transferase, partial [Clostridia bacterium]|nr:glycosyl transferase [Clostridia bacterium]